MESSDLTELLAAGEQIDVEFKHKASTNELAEAVACLANAEGGVLVLGANDDGTVVGAKAPDGQRVIPGALAAMVANLTTPSVEADVRMVDVGGIEVAVIRVQRARSVVATTRGTYVRRSLDVRGRPQCLPMAPNEVLARASDLGAQDLSTVAVHATMDDLDTAELDRMRLLARGADRTLVTLSDRDLIGALGVATPGGAPTLGAVLLFGTEAAIAALVPTHETTFQVTGDSTVRANRRGRAPLLRSMVELADLANAHNPEDEIQDGLFRIGVPAFSSVAVRELIANALVHRNYALRGEVRVAIENGTFVVSNPGGFPIGVTIDTLLTAPPRARNPAIADAFKRAGLVERTGRGIDRVFLGQLESGRPQPDYSQSRGDWVCARMPEGPLDRAIARFAAARARDGRTVELPMLTVLRAVRLNGSVTAAEVADLLHVHADEARSQLARLVDRDVLVARGERRQRVYEASPAVARELQDSSRSAREPSAEQRVLAHVQATGSITRAQTAAVAGLTTQQAVVLLRRLRQAGQIELRGERRGSHYVLALCPPASVLVRRPQSTGTT